MDGRTRRQIAYFNVCRPVCVTFQISNQQTYVNFSGAAKFHAVGWMCLTVSSGVEFGICLELK